MEIKKKKKKNSDRLQNTLISIQFTVFRAIVLRFYIRIFIEMKPTEVHLLPNHCRQTFQITSHDFHIFSFVLTWIIYQFHSGSHTASHTQNIKVHNERKRWGRFPNMNTTVLHFTNHKLRTFMEFLFVFVRIIISFGIFVSFVSNYYV